jgi:2-methylcitrate dehydratase PrpD
VRVETYQVATNICQLKIAETPSSAKFSIPFSVALALAKGKAGVDQYSDENILDPEIRELTEKVDVSSTERWARLYPEKRGAGVRITFTDGQLLFAEVDLPKGEPENPATPEEVRAKFMANAGRTLADDDAEALYETILDLDNRPLKDLVRLV